MASEPYKFQAVTRGASFFIMLRQPLFRPGRFIGISSWLASREGMLPVFLHGLKAKLIAFALAQSRCMAV